eukprot:scaffold471962_cov19-Prasinocladus_malaysianus.AAC.1
MDGGGSGMGFPEENGQYSDEEVDFGGTRAMDFDEYQQMDGGWGYGQQVLYDALIMTIFSK